MTLRPRGILVLAVAAALAAPSTALAHFDSASPQPSAKRKAAKKKCKRGQVRVVINKRRTCRSLKKAMPRPKRGDLRLIYIRSAIGANMRGLRDRKGRRPPSIEKALKRISPRAQKVLERRAVPKAVEMLDGLATTSARAGPPVAGAAQNSDVSFSYDLGNGATIDLRAKLAGQKSIEVAITGTQNGQRVRTTIGANLDLGFRGPDCPTAEGVLEAKDGLRVSITTELLNSSGRVDYYYTQIIFQDTKLRGEVGDDAKLKTLEVTDKLQIGEITGGSLFGGTNIESVARRHTVVNMKTGEYDPGRSNVQVSVAMTGIFRLFQNSALAGATERLQQAADEGFAATVERAMRNYKELETGWNEPNKCAHATLNPASGAHPLDTGERGPISAETTAKDGRKPATARWTVGAMENVAIIPGLAQGNPASLNFTAGVGDRARTVVTAVSKAGVAEADWVQPIRNFSLAKIAGNFTGSASIPVGTSGTARFTWSGGGTFVRTTPAGTPGAVGEYVLQTGSVTYTASGFYNGGSVACNMNGSKFFDLPAHSGSIGVTPVDFGAPFKPGPHDYGGGVFLPASAGGTMPVVLSGCAPGAETYEDTIADAPLPAPPLDTGDAQQRSPDGVDYSGSFSQSESGIQFDWSWTLLGSTN